MLWAKVEGGGSFPAAEGEAYRAALTALVGEDAGRDLAAWRAYAVAHGFVRTTPGR